MFHRAWCVDKFSLLAAQTWRKPLSLSLLSCFRSCSIVPLLSFSFWGWCTEASLQKKTLHLQNLFTQIIQLHTGSQSLVKMPYLRKRWSCLCGFSWTFLHEQGKCHGHCLPWRFPQPANNTINCSSPRWDMLVFSLESEYQMMLNSRKLGYSVYHMVWK